MREGDNSIAAQTKGISGFRSIARNETISFWDKKDNAEAYNREIYPEVLRALSKVVEGTPRVETFEVANSTSHKIAASAV